jgi:hypothetical protein
MRDDGAGAGRERGTGAEEDDESHRRREAPRPRRTTRAGELDLEVAGGQRCVLERRLVRRFR